MSIASQHSGVISDEVESIAKAVLALTQAQYITPNWRDTTPPTTSTNSGFGSPTSPATNESQVGGESANVSETMLAATVSVPSSTDAMAENEPTSMDRRARDPKATDRRNQMAGVPAFALSPTSDFEDMDTDDDVATTLMALSSTPSCVQLGTGCDKSQKSKSRTKTASTSSPASSVAGEGKWQLDKDTACDQPTVVELEKLGYRHDIPLEDDLRWPEAILACESFRTVEMYRFANNLTEEQYTYLKRARRRFKGRRYTSNTRQNKKELVAKLHASRRAWKARRREQLCVITNLKLEVAKCKQVLFQTKSQVTPLTY
eukprot:m.153298 g.153298  ORF g.153298 m.153298 type:complete len:317 (-) comp14286_c0_seq1:220-1170(-)